MTELEECNAIVADVLMAWRYFTDDGRELTGAALLRWRQLPERERAYFRALVAPYKDEHYATRVGKVTTHEGGACTVVYEPPYPEPCKCERPVFVDHALAAVRCVRCLRAWSFKRFEVAQHAGDRCPDVLWRLHEVDRADMGYAIERVLS